MPPNEFKCYTSSLKGEATAYRVKRALPAKTPPRQSSDAARRLLAGARLLAHQGMSASWPRRPVADQQATPISQEVQHGGLPRDEGLDRAARRAPPWHDNRPERSPFAWCQPCDAPSQLNAARPAVARHGLPPWRKVECLPGEENAAKTGLTGKQGRREISCRLDLCSQAGVAKPVLWQA